MGPPAVVVFSGITNPGANRWVLKLGMNPGPTALEDMDNGSIVRLKLGVAGIEGVDDFDDFDDFVVDRDFVDLVDPDFVEEAEDVVDRTEEAMTDLPSSALTYKLSVLAIVLSVNWRERAIIVLYYYYFLLLSDEDDVQDEYAF